LDYTHPYETFEVHHQRKKAERNEKAAPPLPFEFALGGRFLVSRPQTISHYGVE
jgi:hypothetical protein